MQTSYISEKRVKRQHLKDKTAQRHGLSKAINFRKRMVIILKETKSSLWFDDLQCRSLSRCVSVGTGQMEIRV